MISEVRHKQTCLIVGLGQTGLSCARFLVKQGLDIDIVIMDTRDEPPALSVVQHEMPQIIIKTGGLDILWLEKADLIVLSPGIDPRTPELLEAKNKGKEIVGDIELFARYINAPVIAITGSNGKSTVTTLIALMAELSGKNVKVGGNLGVPALDLIVTPAPDFYIVELSSFQLETVKSLNAFAATVLNVSPDHLDRYDSIQDYQQAKQSIFNGDGVMVINYDDPVVCAMKKSDRNVIGFSLDASHGVDFGVIEHEGEAYLAEGDYPLIPVKKMKLAGKHNIANALAALALGSAMALPMEMMLAAITEFNGLSHRCRLVKEVSGVKFYNDSKATNVGATVAAVDGLADQGAITLILGGVGKGQNFNELVSALERAVKNVVLIGEAADEISSVIPKSITQVRAKTMTEAVNEARKLAGNGETVLLSPACASFDMFTSYSDRGDKFESAVKEMRS